MPFVIAGLGYVLILVAGSRLSGVHAWCGRSGRPATQCGKPRRCTASATCTRRSCSISAARRIPPIRSTCGSRRWNSCPTGLWCWCASVMSWTGWRRPRCPWPAFRTASPSCRPGLFSARVALYPANTIKNMHLLREPGIKHVFIGHGDSDKVSSINPFTRVYDEVWVAGRAGRDRWARARVGVRDDAIVEVGRPQLDAVHLVGSAPRPGTVDGPLRADLGGLERRQVLQLHHAEWVRCWCAPCSRWIPRCGSSTSRTRSPALATRTPRELARADRARCCPRRTANRRQLRLIPSSLR